MKVLVTGGTGFIGSYVVEALNESGHTPVILGRKPPERPDRSVYFAYADLRDYESVAEAVSKTDAVIHLASLLGIEESILKPEAFVETNVLGSINVFDACRFFDKPCLFASVGNVREDNNLYAITKFTAERLALMYNKEHGTKFYPVQIFNVYGERQKSEPVRRLVPSTVLAALEDRPITVFGDGLQQDDFIYVRDVARSLVKALKFKRFDPQMVWHLGTGQARSVLDMVWKIKELTNSKSEIVLTQHTRPGEGVRSQWADPARMLVSDFSFTPLEEGLRSTIRYFQSILTSGRPSRRENTH